MTRPQRLRMTIDITMTILSIILMGGNYLFPADLVHEILGVGLFVLWAVHIILNRRWYGAIFRGKYNPYRVMQTVINCCILICTIFLMISGIILSNHIFTFLNIQGGLGFARIAHLLASRCISDCMLDASFRILRQKSFRVLFLPWSALTAFMLLSPAECGNILSSSNNFSSLIWTAATFFLLLIIFPLSFCLPHSRTFWQRVRKKVNCNSEVFCDYRKSDF